MKSGKKTFFVEIISAKYASADFFFQFEKFRKSLVIVNNANERELERIM